MQSVKESLKDLARKCVLLVNRVRPQPKPSENPPKP